ncbi:hypothetical protein [Methylopila sp. M107]|uniref:hypothetical protein n=1 Tax=Methylopila sp. M107 TaxID=1101190 RepID=UPI00036B4FF0|nr:hypothetical protein [Methylopila sp. M107]
MVRRTLVGVALLAAIALGVSIWKFNADRESGPPISGETRAGFLKSAVGGCVALQKASPANAEIPAETITSYCECYADTLAGRVTASDIDSLRGKSTAEMQAAMRPKMAASEQVCLSKLDGKD